METQVKPTLIYYLTLIRMAANKTNKQKTPQKPWKTSVDKNREKVESLGTIGWNVKCYNHYWKQYDIFKKLKVNLPYSIEIPLLDMHPNDFKAGLLRYICALIFIIELFRIANRWKQLKSPSINKWINKMWYIHIMKCYSDLKRKEILI